MTDSIASRIKFNNDTSALAKAKDVIITNNKDVLEDADYIKIRETVSRLIESGLTKMGEGYCISVSDIIFNLLSQSGIKCHLVECQVSIVDQRTQATHLVGFNTSIQQHNYVKVATHVVVVTDTEIPIMIDASIAHKLPNGMQAIVDKFEDLGNKVFAKIEKDDYTLLYQEKQDAVGIPQLHQISILDRINTDKKIFKEIKVLKILNYIGIFVSSFALVNILIKLLTGNW